MTTERQGVLVMAYGTPTGLDDVEAYYTDIRHGRPPPPELLDELVERYRAIGGRSPLLEITESQVRGIEQRLDGTKCYLGFKHAAPFIDDAVRALVGDGVEHAVGLVLAPHYSSMSIGDYERRVRDTMGDVGWTGRFDMVPNWHLEPGYIDLLSERVEEAVASLPSEVRDDALVVFSAHSLPQQIVAKGDPYPEQLRETGQAVAERARLRRWRIGWQSAGRTAVPWIGPDILEILDDLAANKEARAVVICPCGFVTDHLEILFDIDIEATERARKLGIALARTSSPNDDVRFLDTLASIVRRRLAS